MRLIPSTFLLLVHFLHLIFLLSSINAHTSKALCIEKEKQALLDFKLSFVADPLGSLSTWNIHNDDCCDWKGVTCNNHTGHVVELEAGAFLKSYELRPSLLELQHLTSLDLSQNQLTMRIPKFIGSLSKLTSLDLSESEFFGEIPPHLGNLSRLHSIELGNADGLYSDSQYLDLSESNGGLYSDNLRWLSNLSSISWLDFTDVDLSHAIDWASTITMLPKLFIFYCRSCFLPPPPLSSISQVSFSTSLQILDLSHNNLSLSTFSSLINGTKNLQILVLDNLILENNHDEFLEALIKRAGYSLQQLSLVGNNLSKLPSKVMMFPSLRSLDASFNRINASLSDILQYLPNNLTNLDLSSNLLNDVLSDADFSKFSQLQYLYLSNNIFLTFNFSKSWVPPFQLRTLHLSSCKVGPNFPNWILTQKKLEDLDISNSRIAGAIPDAFWKICTRLYSLNISHNTINSKIPSLSKSLLYHPRIDLSSNKFHGRIPHFLFNAILLDLSNNMFSSFPPLNPIKLRPELGSLDLSRNRLSGPLPNWFFQFDELIVLNLESNNFSGTLPGAIGSLWQLTALHLSNNSFSGQLPSSMKNCTELAILELENNKFTGAVPSWLGERMTQLIVLTLRSNAFFGNLPSSLCHLQSLQILDLSDNTVSGPIPGCLHNFSSMATNKGLSLIYVDPLKMTYIFTDKYIEVLDYASVMWKGALADLNSRSLKQRNVINLSGNRLNGGIPSGVTTLKELRSLDLSGNDLSGSIPDKIGQLTSLELLKLSSNTLSGELPKSLADLTFLGTLNLSNNDLSGRIPSSTQLQSFNASSYAGNPKLCGEPLPTKCPGDQDNDKRQPLSISSKDADDSFDVQAFLAALGTGFAFGLLGVLGTLHFNRQFRLAFFQMVHEIADRIFVATSLYNSRIKRSLNLS